MSNGKLTPLCCHDNQTAPLAACLICCIARPKDLGEALFPTAPILEPIRRKLLKLEAEQAEWGEIQRLLFDKDKRNLTACLHVAERRLYASMRRPMEELQPHG